MTLFTKDCFLISKLVVIISSFDVAFPIITSYRKFFFINNLRKRFATICRTYRGFSSSMKKSGGECFLSGLSSSSHLPTRIVPREHTLKRQKGMWGSESVCQRSGVSPRGGTSFLLRLYVKNKAARR